MKFADLLTGFIRLHILRHAAGHEIYGQWMIWLQAQPRNALPPSPRDETETKTGGFAEN